ncbi:MAG: hypothetical protein JSR29_12090 [Nitrospira sp.]|nr:hypothetical protein [Nitrospira sp.]
MAGVVQAAHPAHSRSISSPTVSFEAGDRPGNFFTCSNTGNSNSIGCVPASIGGAKQRSLAVIGPGETVGFPTYSGEASTVHTALSLIYPAGAKNMPFKAAIDVRDPARRGVAKVTLTDPGLYVFICDIHPYMFSAVIVDDPKTKVNGGLGLDLGRKISLVNGITVPTYSDLAIRLLRTFFILTDPGNWKDYTKTEWKPAFPAVPVIVYKQDGTRVDVADLSGVLGIGTVPLTGVDAHTGLPNGIFNPATAAVGEIWVDTQFELTAGKSKPGTATAIDGANWGLTKKIALPTTNMNHPHNMWTDKNHEVIYQTQWFDERLTVFDRKTGTFIRELNAGRAPSHVMTRANNDLVHVAQNGNNYVREFNDLAGSGGLSPNAFIRDIPMGSGGEDVFTATHPHGHWMSADGSKMVTPNENLNTSTVYNFPGGVIQKTFSTGHVPIATGMMPDSSKYYVANFLDNTISRFDMNTNTEILPPINLIANYDPVGGGVVPDPVSGNTFVGALPIQTPVSPAGTNMVTANTLTATITIVDTRHLLPNGTVNPNEDKVVAMLPCDPGCHGVQYGAKQGGGYYAYVASKFSNAMIVVDPDPNGDGNSSDAAIVGRVLLARKALTVQDDTVIGNPGMGGQGILPVPVVYNGWVQQWVQNCTTADCLTWKGTGGLTDKQKAPALVK